jgi:TonB family protein
MNRLQKKCVIATTGFHLLLLVILFVGPAFFWAREKPDDTQVLEMIPANLVDSVTTGVQGAQPPPTPTPPQVKPVATPPAPITKPVIQPTPSPMPTPTLTERVEKFFKPEPDKPVAAPEDKPVHTPKVNLTLTTRTVPKNISTPAKPTPDNSKVVNSALTALRKNLSSPTEIAPVGDSSAAAANYGDVVTSVYHHAWTPPDDMASDNVIVKFVVTIASDATVISAHIVAPSGDKNVDAAVQRMLERVTFIEPFPKGAKEAERNYPINFNATRTIE